jgi:non-heme chloroperoxidase
MSTTEPVLKRHEMLIDGQFAASAPPTAALVKRSKLKVYAGGDHGLCSTYTDQVNADLLAFIRG